MCKKILFLTGTRADFGKLKSLMHKVEDSDRFDAYIFVTGMHMIATYGMTAIEVEKEGFKSIYKYINQNKYDSMDVILAKTIQGLSDYVKELKPDMIVVHGDRVETMAGAIVGSLNNIIVAHIEGGEISGTIDEVIRHSVSKMSHQHFVSNSRAKRRLIQLGEREDCIHVIGSPDLDIMTSSNLPSIKETKHRYEIAFQDYAVFLYHPVTTEFDNLAENIKGIVNALISSEQNYIVIYPNNDDGSDIILNELRRLEGNSKFRVFPSIRFEYFLTLLKNSSFVIGNSSAGVREVPFYGIPTINLGTRQNNRSLNKSINHIPESENLIIEAISKVRTLVCKPSKEFGDGNSDELFMKEISKEVFWNVSSQKAFLER